MNKSSFPVGIQLTNHHSFSSPKYIGTDAQPRDIVSYEVEHLVSFVFPLGHQNPSLETMLTKLSLLDRQGQVQTSQCRLHIERTFPSIDLVVRKNQRQLERFPMTAVQGLQYHISQNPIEKYNNLILFCIPGGTRENSKGQPNEPELHIFRCVAEESRVVAEVMKRHMPLTSFIGQSTPTVNNRIEIQSRQQSSSSDWDQRVVEYPVNASVVIRPNSGHHLTEQRSTESEMYLLNLCFDDIERFVRRLQLAATQYKKLMEEVEGGGTARSKKKGKSSTKKMKRRTLNGIHSIQMHLPPQQDFVECLKKVKLSFNVLARLQGKVKDPSPEDLVRMEFKPLKLIVDARRDDKGHPELAQEVVCPLLTIQAVELLRHTLTPEMQTLWRELGDAWTTPKEQWKTFVPTYIPRFDNGYFVSLTDYDEELFRGVMRDVESGQVPDESVSANNSVEVRRSSFSASLSADSATPDTMARQAELTNNVIERGGRLRQVTASREAQNLQELTVQKNEVVELLEDTRNWYKVRNYLGEVGYCPHTILQPYSAPISGDTKAPSSAPAADSR